MCCRVYHFRGAPEDQGLQGFDRPNAALSAHTHTHASCRIRKFRVAPEDQGLRRFGRRRAAASIHTLFLQNRPIQGCSQGSKVTRAWPTNCCCEHTRVRCIKYQLRPAPRVKGNKDWQINCCTQGSTVTRVWPTNCSCEPCSTKCCCERTHTHVCWRTPKNQGHQGFCRPKGRNVTRVRDKVLLR